MSDVESPCRLFVYLAKDAPLGVILRRGPSDWARLSLWHTDTDIIEHGQWLKGRVYERRSDVSPDGSLFVAFVRQSGGKGVTDSWVAVSRPPYFTALAVWYVGGTYHIGAFFSGRSALWLGYTDNSRPDVGAVPHWLQFTPPQDIPYIDRTPEWTDRTVHFNRLLRDGWQPLENQAYASIWQRPHPSEPLALLMTHKFESFENYGGPYVVEYFVRGSDGREHDLGPATWADWDQQGRLVMSRDGRLLTWDVATGYQTLVDLNDQAPDPQPAPSWAREWPPAP